jgi:GNAT superfamily N-acetyltransferase/predicted Zn-dependent protease with MMP-like domain
MSINNNEISIRGAKSSDMEQLGRIMSSGYHSSYEGILDARYLKSITDSSAAEMMKAFWLNPGAEVLVAVRERIAGTAQDHSGDASPDEVLGFASGAPSAEVLGAFSLEKMFVREDAHGSGIDRDLVLAMGRLAAGQGYPQMTVDVYRGDDRAERFYNELGAKRAKEYYLTIEGFPVASKLLIWDDITVFTEDEEGFVTYDEFRDMVSETLDELPDGMFKDLSGGVIVDERAPVPDYAAGNDISTLGLYTAGPHGRQIIIYYGSFAKSFAHLSHDALLERIRETVRHEFRHHMEFLAGMHGRDTLEAEDKRQMKEYLNRKR